ncbi:EI24 domain-containing protein [Streptomyces sp. BI20]|uniref:EI24 domain-containing protein n=1 Tax=Streptomyces sp. BI20 TaxID=3403460 RepID=UPI003C74929B
MNDLAGGFRHLLAGQRWVLAHPRWLGLGLLPALIAAALYLGALVALFTGADDAVAWLTPFAEDWSGGWLGLFRGSLTVVLIGFGLFLAVVTFTAVTLLIGQPFYEALSEAVEKDRYGGVPESGLPLWRELWISGRDSLRILLRVALCGLGLFALGFVPVLGQTVVPVLGFAVSGWFLTQELTAVALQRRKIELPAHLDLMRGRRALVLGFGVPLVLSFLLPVVAVLLMPGAVAGATLLARDLLAPPGTEPGTDTPAPAVSAPGPHRD